MFGDVVRGLASDENPRCANVMADVDHEDREIAGAPEQSRDRKHGHRDADQRRDRGATLLRDAESELFLLAATNMVGEDTFYERAPVRDARFVALVHHVTGTNPEFVAGLAPYLRTTLLMRSAAVVMAAEYVAAGGSHGRAVVDGVLQRADEPAELLGYWLTTHGRNVPMAVKRGVADAARRLYTERAALRYDGLSRQVRMADVIELTHPHPGDERQSALFRWLLDRRHHDDAVAAPTDCRCSPLQRHSR